MFDEEWQTDRPTEGMWLVSIHPDMRWPIVDGDPRWPWPAVVPCQVSNDKAIGEPFLQWYPGGEAHYLSSFRFTGALWKRLTVPGDPFANGSPPQMAEALVLSHPEVLGVGAKYPPRNE